MENSVWYLSLKNHQIIFSKYVPQKQKKKGKNLKKKR